MRLYVVHSAPMEETNEKDIQIYELSYHIARTLSDSDADALLQAIRDALVQAGGSFLAEGALEESDLAYPINNHTKSLFGWMKFEATPDVVVALKENVLKTQKSIIRYVLIKTVREDTRASAQARTPHAGTGVVQEVETKGVLERKSKNEEVSDAEVSDEALDEALDELTDDK